jgi:two-component system cell cycle response regulator
MRLRGKLMLALLATGLAAVAMVGGLAYVTVTYKIDTIRRQQAAEHFHRYMTAYLAKYGDWQTAVATENFDSFVRHAGGSNADLTPLPPPRRDGLRPAGPPPRPDAPPGGPRPGFGPPPDGGPPPRDRAGPPPFRFILTDADFNVLLGAGRFHPGEALPEKLRVSSRPIVVNGRAVAHMSSEGVLTPTPQEQQYVDAVDSSLYAGAAAAAVLAVGLGVFLSRGLTRRVSKLTDAVRAMHGGELRQRVPVQGQDEVAELAKAFNEMSEQLAQTHEELQASHQTILHQAEQLRELSVRDALTQLYNRRHFDEQAATLYNQAVRHKRPLALAICDIDHFKQINDKFSHATGDAVLRQVASLLRGHMRQADLVARYGGEEFVMAFPETPGLQAASLCDKLRGLIEAYPWQDVHPQVKVTISIGISADIGAGSAAAMLQKADTQLYRAKDSGRNRVCFA